MNSSLYRYGEWGLLEVDPSDGHTVRSLGPAERLYIPALRPSSSVSATLDDLGFDHRFKTPVYAQGASKTARSAATWCSWPAATSPWEGAPRPTGPSPTPLSTTPTPTACRGRRSPPKTR